MRRTLQAILAWVALVGTDNSVAVAESSIRLPAGTVVAVRLLEVVGSNSHQRGAQFNMEVAQDVVADGRVLIPRGASVLGEVVHAAKSGILGKPGELTLAARYVIVGSRQIRFKTLALADTGKDRNGAALGVAVAGDIATAAQQSRELIATGATSSASYAPAAIGLLVMIAIHGKKIRVEKNTELVTKTANDEEFKFE